MANNGRMGEQLFAQIMTERAYIVEDVSGNPDYWGRDIDFLITSPSGATKSFEVKWDERIHKTGNLFLETENPRSKGGKGWFQFCQADYLVYGDAVNRCFYVIPLLELKEKIKDLPYKWANTYDGSVGRLISLYDIADITYNL